MGQTIIKNDNGAVNSLQVSCLENVPQGNSNFGRGVLLKNITDNSSTNYTSTGMGALYGGNTTFEDNACFDNATNRSSGVAVPLVLLYAANESSTTDLVKNSYAVKTGGNLGIASHNWIIRKGSCNPQIQNCYYDSQKAAFTTESDEGAIGKTTAQLKSGNIFTNDNNNWIQVQGYYPILNNQYAVDSITLSSAMY